MGADEQVQEERDKLMAEKQKKLLADALSAGLRVKINQVMADPDVKPSVKSWAQLVTRILLGDPNA